MLLTLEMTSKSIIECCHNLLFKWPLIETPDPCPVCVRGTVKISTSVLKTGRGVGVLSFAIWSMII